MLNRLPARWWANEIVLVASFLALTSSLFADPPAFPADPRQAEERTSFQTSKPWSPKGNLRSDVAIVYGIDSSLPDRVKTWRDRGYRVHLMTGVSWGSYQDYLYGKFDGVNHEDNAQTEKSGKRISHGGDSYYMCPAENFGQFLCVGVQRALEAGVEAVHLEEPEFWARAGYSEGFKREWQSYYKEPWQDPQATVDGQWRASKLKYFLFRRALQQVFSFVKDWNTKQGKAVRCYVPTHSLINYAHWCIVSPESSLARLDGCDGYIAQVWTGTARTPNFYRGQRKERTFETAFLEYGAMQNLVRATGRTVWYLNDPVEDNPQHDWTDYRTNWESTLTASLLQPDVWKYEVAPWPERAFGGRYPRNLPREQRQGMPPEYTTELQVVMNALNDMQQKQVKWECGTQGVGVLVSDSLMFQREKPTPSDPNMAHFYGQAMPLLKRGFPVTPVQLENAPLPDFLTAQRVLLLSYQGQKPLSAEVHTALGTWVKQGGVLLFIDDDSDPYNHVREWWNEDGKKPRIPRQHLFETLGVNEDTLAKDGSPMSVEKGAVGWLHRDPVRFGLRAESEERFIATVKEAAQKAGLTWKETNHLVLRRGPYIAAAGMDESVGEAPLTLNGRLINLFDPELRLQPSYTVTAQSRAFLLDLEALSPATEPRILASACKALPAQAPEGQSAWTVEGVGETPSIVLISCQKPPQRITLEGAEITTFEWDEPSKLLRLKFPNEPFPRVLTLQFAKSS